MPSMPRHWCYSIAKVASARCLTCEGSRPSTRMNICSFIGMYVQPIGSDLFEGSPFLAWSIKTRIGTPFGGGGAPKDASISTARILPENWRRARPRLMPHAPSPQGGEGGGRVGWSVCLCGVVTASFGRFFSQICFHASAFNGLG